MQKKVESARKVRLPFEIWTDKVRNEKSTPADKKKFFSKLVHEFNGNKDKLEELIGKDVYADMTKKVKSKKLFAKSKPYKGGRKGHV